MSDIDSLLSPRHSVSSWLGSEHDDPSISGINLPPSLSSSQGPGGFSIGGSHRGESMANSRFGSSIFRREEDERIFDPGFAFDEDGNIIDTTAAVPDEVADIEMELPSLRDPTVLMDNYVPDVDMEREHDVMVREGVSVMSCSANMGRITMTMTVLCLTRMTMRCTLTLKPSLHASSDRLVTRTRLLRQAARESRRRLARNSSMMSEPGLLHLL